MKKKILFIDRDGTLINEPQDEQIDSLEKLEFYPGVISNLSKISTLTDFELVMVTNQDGLGTDAFPEDSFWPAHNKMMATFENEGIKFKAIHIDRSVEDDNLPTRKPGTGMLSTYFSSDYDLENSFTIGDRQTDVELAANLGCKGIFVSTEEVSAKLQTSLALTTTSWTEIANFLIERPRKGVASRKTSETEIDVNLNLDGIGKSNISTGIGFFDHMLEQISKHGEIDLDLQVKGDLHIDEHHTIEDTAITLGDAFNKALGSKKGIERYGYCLPMDDCLAQVVLDFGGRNWLVWDVDFKREKIGEMPTEMFFHFFKSFSDSAGANINIKAEGQNEHHKIEAIFKAFSKAIKMAVKKDNESSQIPSTKGSL